MSLKILIVLGIVTLIASCASSKPLIWTKAGSTEAQFLSDQSQCLGPIRQEAQIEHREDKAYCRSNAASSCSSNASPGLCKGASIFGCMLGIGSVKSKIRSGMKYCLESKGYRIKEGN